MATDSSAPDPGATTLDRLRDLLSQEGHEVIRREVRGRALFVPSLTEGAVRALERMFDGAVRRDEVSGERRRRLGAAHRAARRVMPRWPGWGTEQWPRSCDLLLPGESDRQYAARMHRVERVSRKIRSRTARCPQSVARCRLLHERALMRAYRARHRLVARLSELGLPVTLEKSDFIRLKLSVGGGSVGVDTAGFARAAALPVAQILAEHDRSRRTWSIGPDRLIALATLHDFLEEDPDRRALAQADGEDGDTGSLWGNVVEYLCVMAGILHPGLRDQAQLRSAIEELAGELLGVARARDDDSEAVAAPDAAAPEPTDSTPAGDVSDELALPTDEELNRLCRLPLHPLAQLLALPAGGGLTTAEIHKRMCSGKDRTIYQAATLLGEERPSGRTKYVTENLRRDRRKYLHGWAFRPPEGKGDRHTTFYLLPEGVPVAEAARQALRANLSLAGFARDVQIARNDLRRAPIGE